jgi:heptosyltransferase-2/heptosyltransferase-3
LRLARVLAPRAPSEPVREPRRMLLVRPDHIGDVLLTAPAVAVLRASLPAAELVYLVGPWSLEAARRGPLVDRVQSLPFPGFTRRPAVHALAPYALLLREAARLRRERYDAAVVFRPDHWWGALLALLAGIPVRVGGDTLETRPLLTLSRRIDPRQHSAEHALGLAHAALDALGQVATEPTIVEMFRVSDEARAAAGQLWTQRGLDQHQVVALQPSAGAPLKSWPIERWARLADGLAGLGYAVLLTGGPDDRPLLAAVQARTSIPTAGISCGRPLDQAAALYARCALFIGLDGGAAHLAAAVGTPTLRLYGPAPVAVYGPWPRRPDQRVLVTGQLTCVPCGNLEAPPCAATSLPACLLALGVDDVLTAAEAQLDHG